MAKIIASIGGAADETEHSNHSNHSNNIQSDPTTASNPSDNNEYVNDVIGLILDDDEREIGSVKC